MTTAMCRKGISGRHWIICFAVLLVALFHKIRACPQLVAEPPPKSSTQRKREIYVRNPTKPNIPFDAVYSLDPPQQANNLCLVGCPDVTIKDILVAEISDEHWEFIIREGRIGASPAGNTLSRHLAKLDSGTKTALRTIAVNVE